MKEIIFILKKMEFLNRKNRYENLPEENRQLKGLYCKLQEGMKIVAAVGNGVECTTFWRM